MGRARHGAGALAQPQARGRARGSRPEVREGRGGARARSTGGRRRSTVSAAGASARGDEQGGRAITPSTSTGTRAAAPPTMKPARAAISRPPSDASTPTGLWSARVARATAPVRRRRSCGPASRRRCRCPPVTSTGGPPVKAAISAADGRGVADAHVAGDQQAGAAGHQLGGHPAPTSSAARPRRAVIAGPTARLAVPAPHLAQQQSRRRDRGWRPRRRRRPQPAPA